MESPVPHRIWAEGGRSVHASKTEAGSSTSSTSCPGRNGRRFSPGGFCDRTKRGISEQAGVPTARERNLTGASAKGLLAILRTGTV